jgi:rubrerythrin
MILKTEENLQKNLAAESMAAMKYYAFAAIAEEEGHYQIGRLFRALAGAEKVHAINSLRVLGEVAETAKNLSAAIDLKTYDFTQRYPAFIEQADKDLNPVASTTFQGALNTAKTHIKLLNEAQENFKRNKTVDYWVCSVCGFIDVGEMPASCKVCGAAREKCSKVN